MSTAKKRERIFLPNDPHPMRIYKDLACEIGLNESIVLLQLEFLISISDNEVDGRIWHYDTLADLKKKHFPFWSISTISRILTNLQDMGLVTIGNYNKYGFDKTQWFALDHENCSKLLSITIFQNEKSIFQNEKSIFQNEKSIFQNEKWMTSNCKMDDVKLQNGCSQNETTIPKTPTEITSETTTEKQASSPAPLSVPFDTFDPDEDFTATPEGQMTQRIHEAFLKIASGRINSKDYILVQSDVENIIAGRDTFEKFRGRLGLYALDHTGKPYSYFAKWQIGFLESERQAPLNPHQLRPTTAQPMTAQEYIAKQAELDRNRELAFMLRDFWKSTHGSMDGYKFDLAKEIYDRDREANQCQVM
jgi:hypothetical protein